MTTPIGYVDDAGYAYSGGYAELVDSLMEHVPDLLWPTSIRTLSRMRLDLQIGASLKAYTLPMRRATWAVDPDGCNPEVAAFVADELGLPVSGQPDAPSGARRRRVSWEKHLRLALLDLTFGHIGFERTYEYDGTRLRLGTLVERMPQTISSILLDGQGELAGIKQHTPMGGKEQEVIKRDALVWYANEREGSNWTGRSLLRPAYPAWLIKHELWRVHATSIRRFGMGVPSVEAPAGATPQQVAEAQRLASSIRGGDQAGVGLPPGFRMVLSGITGSVPDALGFIQYLDQQMTRNTLTGLLDLGSTATGSRALGDTFLDLFLLALQTVADDHADQATSQLVVPLVDLNWGEDEPAPRIVCSDVGSDREVTAATLNMLLTSGALSATPDVEEYVRREWKLPDKAVDPLAPTQHPVPDPAASSTPPGTGAPSVPTPSPVAATVGATVFRRQLTTIEAASKADFAALQDDWETALDSLNKDWKNISKVQRKELLDQIAAAADDDDIAALADVTVSTSAASSTLLKHLTTVAEGGAASVLQEMDDQGVTSTGDPKIDQGRLSDLSDVFAGLLAGGLVAYGVRTALQSWGTPNVSEAVGKAVDGLSGDTLDGTLGSALSAAQNEGRSAAFDTGPEATYYASELMDRSTCAACSDIDGYEFPSLEDARASYAMGGYSECEGGLRCRGIVVAVWP